jgi:hypothetical protein
VRVIAFDGGWNLPICARAPGALVGLVRAYRAAPGKYIDTSYREKASRP